MTIKKKLIKNKKLTKFKNIFNLFVINKKISNFTKIYKNFINQIKKKLIKKKTLKNKKQKSKRGRNTVKGFVKSKIIKKNYGIGLNNTKLLYGKFGFNIRAKLVKRVYLISRRLRFVVSNLTHKNELRLIKKENVYHYIKLKNYKGTRHKYKYPVRGQRTHTNAKTRKKELLRIKSKTTGNGKKLKQTGRQIKKRIIKNKK
jgi:small subunit ribosomal protein S13